MVISKEDLRLAFLRVLEDVTTPMSFVSILRELACELNLSRCDINATLKYSGKRKFYMKAKHARTFLLNKKFIQKITATADVSGGYSLTADGKSFLAVLR